MILEAAKILMEKKEELSGNVRLLFQAAEETLPPHLGKITILKDLAYYMEKVFSLNAFSLQGGIKISLL